MTLILMYCTLLLSGDLDPTKKEYPRKGFTVLVHRGNVRTLHIQRGKY